MMFSFFMPKNTDLSRLSREQLSMRQDLIAMFSRANDAKDMDDSHLLYSDILEVPALNDYFTREEMADVYYNRAANYTVIADFYLQGKNYHEAQVMLRHALSDAKHAEIYYVKDADKVVCSERLAEYKVKRELVLELRDDEEAAVDEVTERLGVK